MPPKAAPKAKKDADVPAAATPTKVKAGRVSKPSSPATPKSNSSALQTLSKDHTHGNIPIEIAYKGGSPHARFEKEKHRHTLELSGTRPFSLVGTVILPNGDYKGLQAIILQPSKPFPFLKLPEEVRKRVYAFYFAPGGVVNAEIPLEAKRKQTKDLWAKSYSNNSPNRIALLAANKEVHDDAIPVLYSHTLRLENTTTLLDFLGQISNTVRSRLTSITIQAYVKTTSRNAMHFLAECGNIQHLHITSGVFSECDPIKASRSFYADAQKFLEAIAATMGSKDAGVDVISFGKQALISKDEQKRARPWSDEQVAEFRELLREKLEK